VKPLTETRIQHGNHISQYLSLRAAEIDKVLVPVSELVTVVKTRDSYVIALGDQWISFVPNAVEDQSALDVAKMGDVTDAYHFGPVLDVAKLAANRLMYKVQHSSKVHYSSEVQGYVFDACPKLGLFMRDWAKFGEDFQPNYVKGEMVLELEVIKKLLLSKDSNPSGDTRLNLDPDTTVALGNFGDHYRTNQGAPIDQALWDSVHDNGTSEGYGTSSIVAGSASTCALRIDRTYMSFDTSGVDTPETAKLQLQGTSSPTTGAGDVDLFDASDCPGYSSADCYGQIGEEFASPIGDPLAANGSYIESSDLVAESAWAESAAFELGVAQHDQDVLDVWTPGDPKTYTFKATGDGAARLLLTYPEEPGHNHRVSVSMIGIGL